MRRSRIQFENSSPQTKWMPPILLGKSGTLGRTGITWPYLRQVSPDFRSTTGSTNGQNTRMDKLDFEFVVPHGFPLFFWYDIYIKWPFGSIWRSTHFQTDTSILPLVSFWATASTARSAPRAVPQLDASETNNWKRCETRLWPGTSWET
jgi:hypothetical protein